MYVHHVLVHCCSVAQLELMLTLFVGLPFPHNLKFSNEFTFNWFVWLSLMPSYPIAIGYLLVMHFGFSCSRSFTFRGTMNEFPSEV